MATIKRGILGGGSGSVANVVMTAWKGVAVIKSKPLTVANPQTAAQNSQRGKFSGIVGIAQYILASILQPVWNGFAQTMSGYNMFIQKNIQIAFNDAGVFQPNSLEISPKDGTTTPIASVDAVNTITHLTINFSPSLYGADQMESDKFFGVAVTPNGYVIGSVEPSGSRNTEECRIELNRPLVTGEIVHCYLAFISADKKRAFRTAHVAKTVTAS